MKKAKMGRKQLVFAVECILQGALDMIEGGLPDAITWKERKEDIGAGNLRATGGLTGYELGAIEAAGEAISILGAQLADVSISCYDALNMAGKFHMAVEKLFEKSWKDKGKAVHKWLKRLGAGDGVFQLSELYPWMPDCHKHAVTFVQAIRSETLC